MKYSILILALLQTCFIDISSAQAGKSSITIQQFPKIIKPVFQEILKFDKGRIKKLFVSDSTLFLWNADGGSDYYFYRYSLQNYALNGKYIKGGRRFGQALGGNCAGLYGDRTLWFYDGIAKKILLTEAMKTPSITDTGITQEFVTAKYYYSVSLMDRSNIVTAGAETGPEDLSKIQLVNLKTKSENLKFGSFADVPNNTPIGAWKNALQGFLFTNPNGKMAVLAYRFTDHIEIFDLETQKSKLIWGPKKFIAEFSSIKQGGFDKMSRNANTQFAFLNGAVTDKYIYLLYSGEHEIEAQSHSFTGKQIYVYSWTGAPVAVIELDRFVYGFTVTEGDNELYAFDLDKQFVVKAKLK